ncbi:MAG TPA: hypothetical protein VEU51_02005, partial [Candidatus Acidoferrales bacterium]|nr:hypothetical protein [Candidatus Acidoferrales bacterium]
MKNIQTVLAVIAVVAPVTAVAEFANAQQINGVPGAPNATMTLDGKTLPSPPLPFGGVIKDRAKDSTP